MNEKKVSIIIPTYSRNKFLKRAIESCINQVYSNTEIIIVDDNDECSIHRKDNENLISKLREQEKRINYIKHKKNMNGAVARNTGIKNSTGDYICFLDDDDEFESNKIKKQVEILEKSSNEVFGVYCRYERKKGDILEFESKEKREGNLSLELLELNFKIGAGSTLMVKREYLNRIGGFNIELERHQDYDLLLKLFNVGKIISIDEILVTLHSDDGKNRPKGDKLLEIKERFFESFKYYLKKLPKRKIKEIRKIHFIEVAKLYLKNLEINKFIKLIIKEKIFLKFIRAVLKELICKKFLKKI